MKGGIREGNNEQEGKQRRPLSDRGTQALFEFNFICGESTKYGVNLFRPTSCGVCAWTRFFPSEKGKQHRQSPALRIFISFAGQKCRFRNVCLRGTCDDRQSSQVG